MSLYLAWLTEHFVQDACKALASEGASAPMVLARPHQVSSTHHISRLHVSSAQNADDAASDSSFQRLMSEVNDHWAQQVMDVTNM